MVDHTDHRDHGGREVPQMHSASAQPLALARLRWQVFKEDANSCFKQQRYADAEALYTRALLQVRVGEEIDDAARAVLLCNRSVARLKQGDADGALLDAVAAGACDDTFPKAYFRRARALLALGRVGDARVALSAISRPIAGAEAGAGKGAGEDEDGLPKVALSTPLPRELSAADAEQVELLRAEIVAAWPAPPAEGAESPVGLLGDELELIAAFLDLRSLGRFAKTNKAFRAAAADPALWRHLDLGPFRNTITHARAQALFAKASGKRGGIVTLSLDGCRKLFLARELSGAPTDSAYYPGGRGCDTQIFDPLHPFVVHQRQCDEEDGPFRSLRTLSMKELGGEADDKRSSACLAHWLSCLPKGCLRSLNLSWTFVFCDNVVPCLYEQTELEVLLLRGCQMNDSGNARLLAMTPKLKELDVSLWPYHRARYIRIPAVHSLRAFGAVGDGTFRACSKLKEFERLAVCGRRGTSGQGLYEFLLARPEAQVDMRHNMSLNHRQLLVALREKFPQAALNGGAELGPPAPGHAGDVSCTEEQAKEETEGCGYEEVRPENRMPERGLFPQDQIKAMYRDLRLGNAF